MNTLHKGQIALGAMYFGTRQNRDESFAILDRFAGFDDAIAYCGD